MNSFNKWNVAFAIGFAFVGALGSPAAAQLGGNPSDAYSCYSDCGVRGGNATQRCACDDFCNVRGDCCADRNLYCSTSVAAPACSLTTNNSNSHGSMFCGTDLGFVVEHGIGTNAKLEVLFGDSWEWDPSTAYTTCGTVGLVGASDDSQGWMSVTRPPSTYVPFRAASIPATGFSDCHPSVLTLDTNDPIGVPPPTYTKIRLYTESGTELQLPPGSTPLAAFSDGTNMWAMFKANGPLLANPEPGRTYLAWRNTATRTNYRIREDLGSNSNDSNLFFNPSATRIASYNATDPKLSNFALPSGTNAGTLLIFGRKKFWSAPGDDADANGMYLVRQDARISTSGTRTWNPQYLTGIDSTTGKPTWSPNKSDAWAMLTAAGTTAGDFKAVNQIDVKWVPALRKWILLYGGDVHWMLESDPPTTDQPRHGAIHMRMADYPWGPWSPPTPLLLREKMRGYFECDATENTNPDGCDPSSYPLGTWESDNIPGTINECRQDLSEPVQPNMLVFDNLDLTNCYIDNEPVWDQRGLLYAPELIPTWTNEGPQNIFTNLLKTVTLYFMVSTWMPYQVVLAAADLNVPIDGHDEGPMVVQVRDYQNKFLTVGPVGIIEPKPPVSNTVNRTTAWWVQLVDATLPKNRPIQIGDIVYFRSLNDNGLTYLSRTGDYVRFDKPGANLESRLQWKIESIDLVRYPVGTNIEYGKTPFAITNLSTRRLKSKVVTGQPNVVRNLLGGGGDSVWTMTWHCQSGDSCP